MAKKTYVKIGGIWKEVKNVWIKVGGVWKQKVIPKVKVNGVWKDAILYELFLYNYGIELLSFRITNSTGSPTLTKQTDHLLLKTSAPGASYVSITGGQNTGLVDVTKYAKLCVEWENTVSSTTIKSRIGLSTSYFPNLSNFVVRTEESGLFNKKISVVDIAALSGSFYPFVQIESSYVDNNLKVYKYWLE